MLFQILSLRGKNKVFIVQSEVSNYKMRAHAGKAIPSAYVDVEEARKCHKYLEEYFGGAYRQS